MEVWRRGWKINSVAELLIAFVVLIALTALESLSDPERNQSLFYFLSGGVFGVLVFFGLFGYILTSVGSSIVLWKKFPNRPLLVGVGKALAFIVHSLIALRILGGGPPSNYPFWKLWCIIVLVELGRELINRIHKAA